MAEVRSINAVTLATDDMAASLAFYRALGFELTYGGPREGFSTLSSGGCHVNLFVSDEPQTNWGRVIFHLDSVDAVDALYERAVSAGLEPAAAPRDAPWGERMFPIFDPTGHDLSFARPLE
jgi:uncharacterized glyoxalase superfamily protein PhnB